VPIRSNGLFQTDYNFRQRALEKMIVEKPEHFFELSGDAACFDCLFHLSLSFRLKSLLLIPAEAVCRIAPAGEKKK